MKNGILFLALIAAMSMHGQIIGTTNDGRTVQIDHGKPIGPQHREIAESSQVATAVIEQTTPGRQMTPYKIAIQFTIHNTSNHELSYASPYLTLDVHNKATGERAKEGPYGCYVHFFSNCYSPSIPRGIPSGGIKPLTIPQGGKYEEQLLLDGEYNLEPGQYSVVGYFCAAKGEGPECFKSNAITITISPVTK
jgi:hypothetical protein